MTDTDVAELESGGGELVPAVAGAVQVHDAHAHPEPRQYILIAVVLVIITALEVAVSYIDRESLGPNFIIAMLMIMALIKFVLVVSWYMHLKTDLPMLRRFFMVGLIGAPVLYFVIILALNALINDYNTPPGP